MARCGGVSLRAACAVVGLSGAHDLGIPEDLKTGIYPDQFVLNRGRGNSKNESRSQNESRFISVMSRGGQK